ncbi:RNA helicase, putative [Plasmodium gallinaceum]|uniref:ATP-dependent RNA helicase n=1 Tax=Plasmodium gallinaceum TaxID=5849 RepID=A0A1J1GQF5_PLAGA|nr:RNA helicase, putative [Plasmodium gallinaceum]CRG94648.1 RNA helicase, putative [Plasmodium gallinaceum]
MIFKPVKIKPSLLKTLKKEGLISIEEADSSSIKILNEDNIKKDTNEYKINFNKNLKKKRKKEDNTKYNEKKENEKLFLKKKKKNSKCVDKITPKLKNKSSIKLKDISDTNAKKKINKNEISYIKKNKHNEDEKKNVKSKCSTVINKKIKKKEKRKLKNYKNNGNLKNIKEKSIKIIKKKEIFDINTIIENEEKFKNIDDVKYIIQYRKWTLNGKINVLYSIMKSLYDSNFFKPTEIQFKTLEHSINYKKDVIVISKTGTGKTLTFCLAILNNIVINKLNEYKKNKKCKQKFRCLILVPTRELALQILNHFSFINKYINLYITTIIGGLNVNKQKRIISKKPEVIICTPGRLRFFLELEEKIDYIYEMKNIRYLACDEVDKMIESSFINDINFIVKRLYKCVNDKKKYVQTFLLSATLGLTVQLQNENLSKLLNSIIIRKEKSFFINLSGDHLNNDNFNILPDGLTLNIVKCEKKMVLIKLFYLLKLYFFNEMDNEEEIKKIIIFVNTINSTKELKMIFRFLFFDPSLESAIPKKFRSNLFLKSKINIYSIHSKLKLKERIANITKFSESNNKSVLFCTDVLSRGIDLDKCDLIVQLNCPITDITFVHRSGRTARNFKKGKCICFVSDDEILKWNSSLKKIGLNLQNLKEFEMIKNIRDNDYDNINKAIACCNEMLELQKKLKENKNKSFLSKLAEEADLVDEESSSDSEYHESDKKSNEKVFRNLLHLKKQLHKLLYKN